MKQWGVFGLANVNFKMKMREREIFVIDYVARSQFIIIIIILFFKNFVLLFV